MQRIKISLHFDDYNVKSQQFHYLNLGCRIHPTSVFGLLTIVYFYSIKAKNLSRSGIITILVLLFLAILSLLSFSTKGT